MIRRNDIAGVILAGGQSRRFVGGAKEEALLAGKPLLDHVIERAGPQVRTLSLSRAGGDGTGNRGLPVVADAAGDEGPLAGLHAGLTWAAGLDPPVSHLATFACDTPCVPLTLVQRLAESIRGPTGCAVAASEGIVHPTLGLFSVHVATKGRAALRSGPRSLIGFARAADAVIVEFPMEERTAFFNINTIEDLRLLSEVIRTHRS